jgi:two-component system response regulator YesN
MNQQTQWSRHVFMAVTQIKTFIDQHPLEKTSIEEFTNLAGINRNLLQKCFKEIYAIKISEYQLLKRMQAAADMLEEGRLTNKQIAYRCGYNKPNNFCVAFRKVFKVPPGAWQKAAYSLALLFAYYILLIA